MEGEPSRGYPRTSLPYRHQAFQTSRRDAMCSFPSSESRILERGGHRSTPILHAESRTGTVLQALRFFRGVDTAISERSYKAMAMLAHLYNPLTKRRPAMPSNLFRPACQQGVHSGWILARPITAGRG
jgi:hypothetical protein